MFYRKHKNAVEVAAFMPMALPQPDDRQPRRSTTAIVAITLGVIITAFLALKLIGSPESTDVATTEDIFAQWRTDWSTFINSTRTRFQTLGEQLSNLTPPSATTSSPLAPEEAHTIQELLEQHLADSLNLDLARISADLPPNWTLELTAPPTDNRTFQPTARLTLTSTVPCQPCDDPVNCQTNAPKIFLEFFPPGVDFYGTLATVPIECRPAILASTTAYLIVDRCANVTACERSTMARAVLIRYFNASTTIP